MDRKKRAVEKTHVVEGIAKVNDRGALTIPAEVRKAVGLNGETTVVASAIENGSEILLRIQVTIDRDQAWFWTREWQDEEMKSLKDYEAGKVTRMDADDFLKEIDNW